MATSDYELQSLRHTLRGTETVDDICEIIIGAAERRAAIEEIKITREAITFSFWALKDDAPGGVVPETEPERLGDLLRNVDIHEIEPAPVTISGAAMARLADALLMGRRLRHVPQAWVVGDNETFSKWLGLTRPISRFLELPVIQHDDLGADKVVLLCGASKNHHYMKARLAVALTLEEK
jgi:hypothetical protein